MYVYIMLVYMAVYLCVCAYAHACVGQCKTDIYTKVTDKIVTYRGHSNNVLYNGKAVHFLECLPKRLL